MSHIVIEWVIVKAAIEMCLWKVPQTTWISARRGYRLRQSHRLQAWQHCRLWELPLVTPYYCT